MMGNGINATIRGCKRAVLTLIVLPLMCFSTFKCDYNFRH